MIALVLAELTLAFIVFCADSVGDASWAQAYKRGLLERTMVA